MGKTQAQINISINIGSQPAWGPSGYNHVDYYYLPDINAYYNVVTAQYIYQRGNKWRFAKRLPNRYRNYNIYNAYKVVVNRQNPYNNNYYDIQHYSQYKGRNGQAMLRDNHAYKTMYNNNYNSHNTGYNTGNSTNYKNGKYDNGNKNGNRNTITKREDKKAVRNVQASRTPTTRSATRSTVQRTR